MQKAKKETGGVILQSKKRFIRHFITPINTPSVSHRKEEYNMVTDIIQANPRHKYRVRYDNMKGKPITIPCYTVRHAEAIGKSLSLKGNFKIYSIKGDLVDVYENDKPVRV